VWPEIDHYWRQTTMPKTMPEQAHIVRELRPSDQTAVSHILRTSEYLHWRCETDDISGIVDSFPAAGAFSVPSGPLARVTGGTLQALLLVNWLVPPSAWIGGFAVGWSEGEHYARYLDLLLPTVERAAAERGARWLYYSGGDFEGDWLRDALEERGFSLVSLLR